MIMIHKGLPGTEVVLNKAEYFAVNMAGCIITAIIVVLLFTQEVYEMLSGIGKVKQKKVGLL